VTVNPPNGFSRNSHPVHAILILSRCGVCGRLVGASLSIQVLTILEEKHQCPMTADTTALPALDGQKRAG
jgi:hypothetical protein